MGIAPKRLLLATWIVLLAAALAVLTGREQAAAHATLGSTDPPANEIVSSSPGRVELRFTEPVEESYTAVVLVDQTGADVPGTSFAIDPADDTIVRLVIPDDLARGTYSVVWRTLSAADGHRFSGYFAFTIGSTADVRTVIPPTFDAEAGAPSWLEYGVRWFVYVTLSALAGLWFVWIYAVRPALAPVWQVGPGLVPGIRMYALLAGGLYLLGAVLALITQVWGQTGGDAIGAVSETLTDTRWGSMWVLRVLFGSLLTMGLMIAPWWWPRRSWFRTIALVILSACLALPHALVSHASASSSGRTEAIAADFYHLLAMAVWFGGLLLILATLLAGGDLLPAGRRAVLAGLLPRFSIIALISWAAIGLTGLYAGYLQVGAWSGLTDTGYGRSLLFKLAALAVVLVVAAINLLWISRRVRQSDPARGNWWWLRFGTLVGVEVVGVLIALVFVGRMTAIEPARSVLAERANQREVAIDLNGRASSITIAPGSAGPNHFRLDIGGDALPDTVTASILLHPPLDMAGDKLIELERTTGNAFEAHSAEMSVTGEWQMTVTIAQVGAFQWSAETAFPAPERKAGAISITYPDWVINRAGLGGFITILAGLMGLVVGVRATSRSTRREGLGLGAVAVLAGCLLLLQGRSDASAGGIPLDTPNPVPVTDQAIAVGEASFQANCIACHGVGGAGDGPAGAGLVPPPANLLLGHAIYHADAEFFNWIRDGKPGTAMPAYAGTLTDEQIWSTILYIRTLQQEYRESLGTPHATPIP